jgi:CHAT domain-containing protein
VTRLAVLSGCDTAVPDRDLLDEVVSLPGALLQAGAAGVVATQWKVDDQAAMLLVLRFFERWRDGVPPARALVEAQAWLRTANNGQLRDQMPDLYPSLEDHDRSELPGWVSERPFADPDVWAAFSYTGA